MESRPAAKVVRFGVFELDAQSGELRRNGLKVRLPDQSFQILKMLLANPGEPVTREALRHALWTSDTFVDFEGGLNSAVRKLREALDDSAENPRFVVTLPRRGYRFIAPVQAAAEDRDTQGPTAHVPTSAIIPTAVATPPPYHPTSVSLAGGLLLAGTIAIVGVGHTGDASIATAPRGERQQTVDSQAYAAYLNGMTAAGLQRHEGFARAVAYFEEAVRRQPDYAEAHAALGFAQLQLLFGGPLAPREVIPKAEAAARRAIQLDDTNAKAHHTLGQILSFYYWDWKQAEKEHQRAAQLEGAPGALPRTVGASLIRHKQFAAAVVEAERARQRDPLSFPAQMAVGAAYRAAGQPDRAVAEYRRALEMIPGQTRAHFQLGGTFVALGRFDEAIRELEAAVPKKGGNSRFEAYLGYAYAAAGRTHEATQVLHELEARRQTEYVSWFGIAMIHDALGEQEAALAALERAYQDRAIEFVQMAQYPPFKSIASDPRYQAMIRGVGLPQ